MSTVEPLTRNSKKSNFDITKKIKILPGHVRIQIIPIGTMASNWDNFNFDHYRRVSTVRAEIDIEK
jgi:hypothetical protein